MLEKRRDIIFYQDHFLNFFRQQPEKTKKKMEYVLMLIRTQEHISQRFLKYMEGTDALYEIRVETENKNYRIFCCFDEDRIVILFNAFLKKTQKTPRKEMEKAVRLKKAYFKEKETYDPKQ